MDSTSAYLDSLRPAGSKRSSKRDLIVNVFLRQEGHLSADDLVDLIRKREDSADQPRDRLPHAAVDGRRRDRAEGRFRRGPVPVRALVPASAALPSDLQDLQPVVRVPQLRHRGAGRGGRGGARLHAAAERAADLRHVRGLPDRTARRSPTAARPELLFARDALRIAIATERSGLEFYTRAASITRDARGRRVFEKLAEEEKEHLGTLEARYRELLQQDPQLESRPTFLFFKGAANGLFAAGAEQLTKGVDDQTGAADRHPLRARLAPVLQAIRRAVRGLRGQADLPRVRRRRAGAPRAADPRVPRARRAAARAARPRRRRKPRPQATALIS